MTLSTIWDIVHAVLKKESRGNIIKPDEFTTLLQQCHLEYYNQQYEKWAVSQTSLDSLRPFLVFDETASFSAGSFSLTSLAKSYKHLVGARIDSSDAPFEIVTPDVWGRWYADAVMAGSSTWPLMTVNATQIKAAPAAPAEDILVTYLAELDDNITSAVVNSTTDASGATTNKLIDDGQSFTSSVSVGMKVCNTTDSTTALITAVDSNTELTLDTDIMGNSEDYQIIQADAATNYYLPFFDYYIDSNDEVQYMANASFNTLTANDTYRDGTAGDGSTVYVGLSHELKWGNQDVVNIVSLLLQKLGVAMQAPDITQYAMALQQQQNVA
jgi:hypothetical protein